MIKIQRHCILALSLLVVSSIVYGNTNYEKQWNVGVISGAFSNDSPWRYYLEPQVRFINDPYVFNQSFFLTGLGYQFSPTLVFYTGPGYIFTMTTQGNTFNTYRAWQELDWQAADTNAFRLSSRTRLQEDTRSDASGTLTALRQRYWLRIPIKNSNHYFYSFYDELFFNLDEPSWGSHSLIQQNRVFIGIGKQLTKTTLIDFGYINQAEFGSYDQVNNIILLSFLVTL